MKKFLKRLGFWPTIILLITACFIVYTYFMFFFVLGCIAIVIWGIFFWDKKIVVTKRYK